MSGILPVQANKFACQWFMDSGGRHKTLESETKNSIARKQHEHHVCIGFSCRQVQRGQKQKGTQGGVMRGVHR